MSTDETRDDERDQLPPMPPGWMPATEADVAGIRSHIDRHWQPLIFDLMELDRAGALGGIRAIVGERLRQVRGDDPDGVDGRAVQAAYLAAEIDRG